MPLVVGLFVVILFSLTDHFRDGLIFGGLAAVIALYIGQQNALQGIRAEFIELRRQLAQIRQNTVGAPDGDVSSARANVDSATNIAVNKLKDNASGLEGGDAAAPAQGAAAKQAVYVPETAAQSLHELPQSSLELPTPVQTSPAVHKTAPGLLNKAWDAAFALVKSYFTDGNLFVRIGILILFAGVSFLLKYAAEHSQVPIEFRISAVALGGVAMLYFGWRMRVAKGIYALLLQGGGVGIIYLSIFAAYRIYQLLPSLFTFALLVALAAFVTVLAVIQNSRSLAAFGISGGFVAPILASSGAGDYVALFSYYLLLNLGVLGVAWFKSWRIINLLGFGFTYLVYVIWFFDAYQDSYLFNADAFLLAFFLLFSATGVLHALRQPLQLKGYVDGTLVFGNPLIAWSLQMAMMKDVEYGIAVSAIAFGGYHVVIARGLWNRHREGMRLFTEAALAVGGIFLTLAIPYSLDGHWTSATWALEGAGLLWISMRQQRKYTAYFAMLLQLASAIVFMMHYRDSLAYLPVLNAYYLGAVFIALSGLFSSYQLYLYRTHDHAPALTKTHIAVFIWSMLWWLFAHLSQIDIYVITERSRIEFSVLLVLLSSMALWLLSRKMQWIIAQIAAVVWTGGFVLTGIASLSVLTPVFGWAGAMLWVIAVLYTLWLLGKIETLPRYTNVIVELFSIAITLYVLLFNGEVVWWLRQVFNDAGAGWQMAFWFIVPAALLGYLQRYQQWPYTVADLQVHKAITALAMGYLLLWSMVVNLSNNGDAAPLTYLPVLNPVDMAHIFIVLLFLAAYQQARYKLADVNHEHAQLRVYLTMFVGGVLFIWINAIVLRSIHHYVDVPYYPDSLIHSGIVQVAISILWTILGMLAMLYAARRSYRKLWMAGAVLVGIVLVKLMLVDLSSRETVERIVVFMVVGLLLVGMGYFSPIPQRTLKEKE